MEQQNIEDFDFLKFKDLKAVQKILENDELILSIKIRQLLKNDNSFKSRNLLISNNAIYILESKSPKQKSLIENVIAISQSISSLSTEFVLHIKNSFDFRIESNQRDLIIQTIMKEHKRICANKQIQPTLPIYYHDESKLEKYSTTQMDFKKNVFRNPNASTASSVILAIQLKQHQEQQKQLQEQNKLQDLNNTNHQDRQFSFSNQQKSSELLHNNSNTRMQDYVVLKNLGKGAVADVVLVLSRINYEAVILSATGQSAFSLENINFIIANSKVAKIIGIKQLQKCTGFQFPFKQLNHLEDPISKTALICSNVINMNQFFTTQNSFVYLTDSVQYASLSDVMRHGKNHGLNKVLSEIQAKQMFKQIALAFDFFHKNGFIYRNLMPENILFDKNGHLKLTDYGINRMLSSMNDQQENAFWGSYDYLPPEVFQNDKFRNASDWYQLGAVLYESLIGVPPFFNENRNVMFQLIIDGVVEFPACCDLTAPCKDIILNLLCKDPQQRLGGKQGLEDVQSHKWLEGEDWQYNPNIKTIIFPLLNNFEILSQNEINNQQQDAILNLEQYSKEKVLAFEHEG